MRKHLIIIGLGGNGFQATCACGWRTTRPSWDRVLVASARDDFKIRQRLRSVP
jgi:hypothetical protein